MWNKTCRETSSDGSAPLHLLTSQGSGKSVPSQPVITWTVVVHPRGSVVDVDLFQVPGWCTTSIVVFDDNFVHRTDIASPPVEEACPETVNAIQVNASKILVAT